MIDYLTVMADEAHFTFRESINSHNCRILATENPRAFVQAPLPKRKSQCGMDLPLLPLPGPFSLKKCMILLLKLSVTSEKYADMLQNYIIPSLTDKYFLESMTFMQNGTLPHIARQMKDLLCRLFGEDLVLNCYLCLVYCAWPSRSPEFESV